MKKLNKRSNSCVDSVEGYNFCTCDCYYDALDQCGGTVDTHYWSVVNNQAGWGWGLEINLPGAAGGK